MSRPLGKESLYAKELCLQGKRHGSQKLLRAGGADRLSKLDPSFAAVLMKKTGPYFTRKSLAERGMARAPRISGIGERLVESAIQEALKERGLA